MIIGIHGKAGVGKDTFADYLQRCYGFEKMALSDPMKEICADVFAFRPDQLYGPSEMRNKGDPRYVRPDGSLLTPREALQLLGTEWGRRCWPDVWVSKVLRDALALLKDGFLDTPPPKGVVIPDVRFENEARAIRRVGTLVFIERASVAPLTAGVPNHESERGLPRDLADFVIEAREGIPEFHAQIDDFMRARLVVERQIKGG